MKTNSLLSLWAVLNFNASDFQKVTLEFINLTGIIDDLSRVDLDVQMTEKSRIELINGVGNLKKHAMILEATVTILAIEELSSKLQGGAITIKKTSHLIKEIQSTLRRELSRNTIFVLENARTKYFEPKEPIFGRDVATKYPQAAYEVDEAAKCLAFDRSTAAVFHLMRTLEIGIKSVAKCLSIPDPVKPAERNWGKMLEKIKAKLNEKNPSSATCHWSSAGEREFFESAYVSLDGVKNAWRNTTMHVENKYTFEEAEHIFEAVRGFMKKLASRMDEDGLPLA